MAVLGGNHPHPPPWGRCAGSPPPAAYLFAVSNSLTGHGFFFDPTPLITVSAVVIIISVLFWIPMVRHITRPLARMTRAAERIAGDDFNVPINERRKDEIGQLAKGIRNMAQRLAGYVHGQKRFLGDVAHELGSPIARIQFGLSALEQRVEESGRDRVRDVLDDVDHMSRLVGELLAFSRADLKDEAVELKKLELFPIIEEAVRRDSHRAPEVNLDVAPGITLLASKELLNRALSNLLRNAAKYAGEARPIDIRAWEKGGKILVEVADQGSGVPEELLDQLFEPFFRPDTARSSETGGVGLGLAIVKTCVERCRGRVYARNRDPQGFVVTVILGGG